MWLKRGGGGERGVCVYCLGIVTIGGECGMCIFSAYCYGS